MRIAQTIADAQLIHAVARVAQPDGPWLVYEQGDALSVGLFGGASV